VSFLLDRQSGEKVLEIVEVKPDTILDIATGTGDLAILMTD
jgi:ubiquinone/menaquinone biosynthesis C-methylase UbiE